MSNFAFLQPEWTLFFEAATKAAGLANIKARTSGFYARRTLELSGHSTRKDNDLFAISQANRIKTKAKQFNGLADGSLMDEGTREPIPTEAALTPTCTA